MDQSGAGDGVERGPRFDDAMKALAEHDPMALLAVLPPTAGIATGHVWRPLDRELSRSTVRADLLGRVGEAVVHGEYVKDRRRNLPLRMVEYRAQIRRRHPTERIVQFVLALGDDLTLPDGYEDPDGLMVVRWTVVRASDLDRELLLARPATAPLATLVGGSSEQRAAALTAAVDLIAKNAQGGDRRLLDAAATLASIHLPLPIIETALQEATMPVPIRDLPLARALLAEGRSEGRAEGRAEGRSEQAVETCHVLLRRRFGGDPRIEHVARTLAELPFEELVDKIDAASRLDDLMS